MRRCAALGVSHLHDRLLFNGFQHMRRQCIFRGTHKDPDKKTALDMSQYYDGYSKTDFTILLVDTMCLPGYTRTPQAHRCTTRTMTGGTQTSPQHTTHSMRQSNEPMK